MMPVMSEEEVEEIIRLDGMDLQQLARSFPTGPVRVEKHGDSHYLFRQSEGPVRPQRYWPMVLIRWPR